MLATTRRDRSLHPLPSSLRVLLPLLVVALLVSAAMAQEPKLTVGKADTVGSVLAQQVGKRVTLELDSGKELTGVVKSVGEQVVHLGELSGKEFFDAVVDLDHVAAVVIRVR